MGRTNKAPNVPWTCGGLLLDNISHLLRGTPSRVTHPLLIQFNLLSHLQETWVVHP